MKWLVRFGIAFGVVVVLFLVVGFMLPSDYQVERSVVIEAKKEQVHALVGDLSRWPQWEPWKESDPSIVTTLGDQASGVGAHQSWTGDSGNGELTFTKSSLDTGVEFDMVFDDQWKSRGSYTYEEQAHGVKVTWGMTGDAGMNIVGRYFNLAMDGMVGPMFERGLEKLAAAAPKEPVTAAAIAADVAPPSGNPAAAPSAK